VDIDPHHLPEDPALLRQMVTSLVQEAEVRERRLRQLQHWPEQLLRARYGPRRERVNENELFLFAVALVSAGREAPAAPAGSAATEKTPAGTEKRKGHGRGAYRNLLSGNGWSTIWVRTPGSVRSARAI
jgi:hypothetical protein